MFSFFRKAKSEQQIIEDQNKKKLAGVLGNIKFDISKEFTASEGNAFLSFSSSVYSDKDYAHKKEPQNFLDCLKRYADKKPSENLTEYFDVSLDADFANWPQPQVDALPMFFAGFPKNYPIYLTMNSDKLETASLEQVDSVLKALQAAPVAQLDLVHNYGKSTPHKINLDYYQKALPGTLVKREESFGLEQRLRSHGIFDRYSRSELYLKILFQKFDGTVEAHISNESNAVTKTVLSGNENGSTSTPVEFLNQLAYCNELIKNSKNPKEAYYSIDFRANFSTWREDHVLLLHALTQKLKYPVALTLNVAVINALNGKHWDNFIAALKGNNLCSIIVSTDNADNILDAEKAAAIKKILPKTELKTQVLEPKQETAVEYKSPRM